MKLINYIKKFFLKFYNSFILWRAQRKLQSKVDEICNQRRLMRYAINKDLKKFFGIDANSKFIPKSFKNSAEVKVFILENHGDRMKELNVEFNQLFN